MTNGMVLHVLNRCGEAQKVVLWVVTAGPCTRGSGMQKAAAARAFGEGEQQQAGMAVSWHQEGARERGGGVGWRAVGSVEAAAGRIGTGDSARGDGTFGDGSAGCGAEKQG